MPLKVKNLCLIGLFLFAGASRSSFSSGDYPGSDPLVGQQHDFDLLSNMGLSVLRKMGINDSADCADIVQEAAIRLLRSPTGYSGRGNYQGFLVRVLKNAALNYLSRVSSKDASLSIELPARGVRPDEILQTRESVALAWRRITELISRTSSRNRMPYLLSMEGVSYEEISTILNIKIGTVKSGLMRVTDRLDARLRGFNGSGENSGYYPPTIFRDEVVHQFLYSPLGAEPSRALEAIGLLPDAEERRMLIWFVEFSCPTEEIAMMAGVSKEQVLQTLRRAQVNLVALWERYRLSPENRFLVDPS